MVVARDRDEAEAGPGARPVRHPGGDVREPVLRRHTGRVHELDRVIEHRVVHEDLFDESLDRDQGVDWDHLLGAWRARAHAPDDLALLERGRIVDDDLHQEPVSLCLGQRVHAF